MTKMKWFLVCFLAVWIRTNGEFIVQQQSVREIEDNICAPKFCQNTTSTSGVVATFCSVQKGQISQRCCLYNESNVTLIIGVDYTSCNLTQLTSTIGSLNKSLVGDVEIMDVTKNLLSECGTLSTFAGFKSLEQLYLTSSALTADICNCPGGNYSWTVELNGHCLGRKPLCNSTFSPNVNCTHQSTCEENGPGNFLCNCKENFHGYKCLNEGTFPSVLFTSTICGTTLVLCAFLWHTQRRKVKKHLN